MDRAYVSRMVNLTTMAPDIVAPFWTSHCLTMSPCLTSPLARHCCWTRSGRCWVRGELTPFGAVVMGLMPGRKLLRLNT